MEDSRSERQMAAKALAKEQQISVESAMEIVWDDGVDRVWSGITNRRLDRTYGENASNI